MSSFFEKILEKLEKYLKDNNVNKKLENVQNDFYNSSDKMASWTDDRLKKETKNGATLAKRTAAREILKERGYEI